MRENTLKSYDRNLVKNTMSNEVLTSELQAGAVVAEAAGARGVGHGRQGSLHFAFDPIQRSFANRTFRNCNWNDCICFGFRQAIEEPFKSIQFRLSRKIDISRSPRPPKTWCF